MKKMNNLAIIISFFMIFTQCNNNNEGPNEFFGIHLFLGENKYGIK